MDALNLVEISVGWVIAFPTILYLTCHLVGYVSSFVYALVWSYIFEKTWEGYIPYHAWLVKLCYRYKERTLIIDEPEWMGYHHRSIRWSCKIRNPTPTCLKNGWGAFIGVEALGDGSAYLPPEEVCAEYLFKTGNYEDRLIKPIREASTRVVVDTVPAFWFLPNDCSELLPALIGYSVIIWALSAWLYVHPLSLLTICSVWFCLYSLRAIRRKADKLTDRISDHINDAEAHQE